MNIITKQYITSEWINAFPLLKNYTQTKLYVILGPFIVGLELINLPRVKDYRPHFVLYPLYRENAKSCLKYPDLMFQFYNDEKLQIDLPYDDNMELYKEAQQLIVKQLKISFNRNLSLPDFFRFIDEVLISNPLYKTHHGMVATLHKLKLYAAIYTEDLIQIQRILSQIENEKGNWNSKILENWFGNFDLWIEELKYQAGNQKALIELIEQNKKETKISKLNRIELIA